MVPHERSGVSLRWEFVPEAVGKVGAVHWRWRAFTQGGHLHAASVSSFETLSECIEDAKRHGYNPPAG